MAQLIKRGDRYYVRLYVGNRKTRDIPTKTGDERLARRIHARFEAQDPTLGLPTSTPLATLLDDFVDHLAAKHPRKSARNDVSRLRQIFGTIAPSLELPQKEGKRRRRLAPTILAKRRIEDLTIPLINRRLDERSKTVGPKSVNGDREILSRLFAYAIEHHGVVHPETGKDNPIRRVKRQYGYDQSDNRLFERVTQHGIDNIRSFLYEYDPLDRLIRADMGELNDYNDGFKNTGATPPRIDTWGLDHLGNWSGEYVDPAQIIPTLKGHGITGDVNWDQQLNDDDLEYDHLPDARNELLGIELTVDGGTPTSLEMVYDLNGCLVADEDYYYQYDAWNRLIRVSDRGSLEFEDDGRIDDGTPGQWLVEFVYDALGRRIAKRQDWGDQSGDFRQVEYFYDGVRCVAEVIKDPIEDYGTPRAVEFTYATPDSNGNQTWTDREYVWSPFYVDDLVVQVDAEESPFYSLQDANENVVGLVDEYGQVYVQYTYDPYGTIRVSEHIITPHAKNRTGHQGLFVDRLGSDPTCSDLETGNPILYFNRNRAYAPDKGRFLQRDPNASNLLGMAGTQYAGSHHAPRGEYLALSHLYYDGMSLHAYVCSSPLTMTDPTGRVGYISGMMTGVNLADMAMDMLGQAYQAIGIGATLMSTMVDGATLQEIDVDWALVS